MVAVLESFWSSLKFLRMMFFDGKVGGVISKGVEFFHSFPFGTFCSANS